MNKLGLFILSFNGIIFRGDCMNILIAMDSFKGSLSSHEIGYAIKSIIESKHQHHHIIVIPMADGGEGTVTALTALKDAIKVSVEVSNPLFNPVTATYAMIDDTAIIEMAASSGLTLIEDHERNPLYTSTYGLGELVKDALQKGAKKFIIGLGGSATNDAGIGFLNALGYQFLDASNTPLKPIGLNLSKITTIDDSQAIKIDQNITFHLACDVNNPFSGLNGAAYIYAAQKGATMEAIEQLDIGLKHYALLIKNDYGFDLNQMPSTGAAGGLAAGFIPFFNTTIDLGTNLMFKLLDLESKIKAADLIITGEGKVDHQTLMNKAPYAIIKKAIEHKKQVLVIAGKITKEGEELNQYQEIVLAPLYNKDTVVTKKHLNKSATIKALKKTINQVDYLFK
jgi:glycerate kinase